MIDTEPRQQITPGQQTVELHVLCKQMTRADTRHEREQILERMADLIRTPTTALFGDGCE